MSYERDEALRLQEATEAMIRMREVRSSPHPDQLSDELTALRQEIVQALCNAEVGYSIRLVRLVDGVSTYLCEVDGDDPREFAGYTEALEHVVSAKWNRAADVILALNGLPSLRTTLPVAEAGDTKCTQRPWYVSTFEINAGGTDRVVMGADGYAIAYVNARTVEENDRDAALIVEAVNTTEPRSVCGLCALGFKPFRAEKVFWHQVNGRDPFRCSACPLPPSAAEKETPND